MRVARVVGNVVSTIKDPYFNGKRLMIVEYLDEHAQPVGERTIAFDACDCGIGDTVLVIADGGASMMLLGGIGNVVTDVAVAGVIAYATFDGEAFAGNSLDHLKELDTDR